MQNKLILVVLSSGLEDLLSQILSTGRLLAHLLHLVLCQRLLLMLIRSVDLVCQLALEVHCRSRVSWYVEIL